MDQQQKLKELNENIDQQLKDIWKQADDNLKKLETEYYIRKGEKNS
jgi:hypothetical protein